MRNPLILAAAFSAAALGAAPAVAESYTLLIYESPAELKLRGNSGEAGAAYWSAYAAYGQALAEAGVLRGGAGLTVPAEATALTLGGYFTLETATRAEAERLAATAPAVRRGGRVELRANVPAMAPTR